MTAADPEGVLEAAGPVEDHGAEGHGAGDHGVGDPSRSGALAVLTDRLNPILVREVQQALAGRMFLGALVACLSAILIFGLVVAIQGQDAAGRGLDYFSISISVFAPIVLFVVPIQAFISMRSELQPGTVEQLLMSRLRPRQIVVGKVAASMVQYLLFVSIFAPLMSTLYMLQGLDLPTIGLTLLFSFVGSLVTTTAAISAAALARFGPLQPLAYAGVAFGLGMGSLLAAMGSLEGLRFLGDLIRFPFFWTVMQSIGIGAIFAIALFGMIAASQLTHEHENRSTAFRVYACVTILTALFWTWYVMPSGMPIEPMLALGWPGVGIGGVVLVAVFGLFAVSESSVLSPRVAAHTPSRPLASMLVAPWLPGSGRGSIFVLLALGLAIGGGLGLPRLWGIEAEDEPVRILLIAASYTWIYLGLTGLLRDLLRRHRNGTLLARVGGPLLVILGSALPYIIEVAFVGEIGNAWHWGRITEPFSTLDQALMTESWGIPIGVGCGALAMFGIRLPAMVRGVVDVVRAGGERRTRGDAA